MSQVDETSAARNVRDTKAKELKFQSLAADLRRGILAGDWAPGSKLPTESQLSKETGLSLTTVRRAFDELVAQGLVDRRQGAGSFVCPPVQQTRVRHTVGVLVPTTQMYYPKVLQGIEESLSASGARMQLATYNYDRAEEHRDLQFLLDSGIDGLLVVPTLLGIHDPAARVHELMNLSVPAVLLERRLLDGGPDDRSEYVCSDHAGGAFDAAHHLHGLGNDKIVLVARSKNPTIGAVTRGFDSALSTLGLEATEHLFAPKEEWDDALAARYVDQMRDMGAQAALVFGDREATLVARAALRKGLRIPEDLALVSYDDETADLAEIPLTAVAPPKFRVGRVAADVMVRRLLEGDACPVHQILLRPRIVVRNSCGAIAPTRTSASAQPAS